MRFRPWLLRLEWFVEARCLIFVGNGVISNYSDAYSPNKVFGRPKFIASLTHPAARFDFEKGSGVEFFDGEKQYRPDTGS
jgi:hypothetical protein